MALRSALFKSEVEGADALRGGALAVAAMTFPDLPGLPDGYLFGKIVAAEGEVSRRLAVPLEPTEIFTEPPTEGELAALAGAPYRVEPGYDLTPDFFSVSKWGYLDLRYRPIIDVHDLRIVYPNVPGQDYVIPPSWIRPDKDYGRVQIFPSATMVVAPISIFTIQSLASGNNVPDMVRVKYSAGLTPLSPYWGEVYDIVLRLAVCRILSDGMRPQSESVSADGLSQSRSVDVSKLEAGISAQLSELAQKMTGPIYGCL